jgi:hypothetical protein
MRLVDRGALRFRGGASSDRPASLIAIPLAAASPSIQRSAMRSVFRVAVPAADIE